LPGWHYLATEAGKSVDIELDSSLNLLVIFSRRLTACYDSLLLPGMISNGPRGTEGELQQSRSAYAPFECT
jgi:hypothetical protein